jgi:DNA-binding transcriptional LysR family regulator
VPLVRELRKCSASIVLRTIRTNYLFLSPIDQLRSSDVDLALGFFGKTPKPQSKLLAMPLFEDKLVCILREAHPRARRKLDLRAFLNTPHIRVLYPPTTCEAAPSISSCEAVDYLDELPSQFRISLRFPRSWRNRTSSGYFLNDWLERKHADNDCGFLIPPFRYRT